MWKQTGVATVWCLDYVGKIRYAKNIPHIDLPGFLLRLGAGCIHRERENKSRKMHEIASPSSVQRRAAPLLRGDCEEGDRSPKKLDERSTGEMSTQGSQQVPLNSRTTRRLLTVRLCTRHGYIRCKISCDHVQIQITQG